MLLDEYGDASPLSRSQKNHLEGLVRDPCHQRVLGEKLLCRFLLKGDIEALYGMSRR